MEIDDLPGFTVDVPGLLRGLGAEELVLAVKAVVISASKGSKNRRGPTVCLRARGITVDVPELLRGLGRRELLVAVRQAVEPWPAVKQQLVQELIQIASRGSDAASEASTSPRESGTEVLRLPQISTGSLTASPGKPPKLPGTGPSRGAMSRSLPSLPGAGAAGGDATRSSTTSTAEDRDAMQLGDRLLRAVKAKDLPMVQSLMVARANVEHTSADGARPSTLAMLQGTPPGVLRTLLEARADVHVRDGQGRSLVHLWGWSLPKSRPGMKEAQKKLASLVSANADLDAQLPSTGDTTLHILAKVFNTLSVRASGGSVPGCDELALGDTREAEKFAKATQFRLDLLASSGANSSLNNSAGRRPLDLIERRFWPVLSFAAGEGRAPGVCLEQTKLKAGRRVIMDDRSDDSYPS